MNKNFNFDYISEEDMKEYYRHRILIVGGFDSGKTGAWLI